ncbi:cbb3-type cytochrome oxidase assembly protein CcoS [Glaciecola sp. MF2-115]|uniref:cbb3-type cytochrome oxidase assembly protein CcoS n=1 Tax=Glaciecola sp. MF2-115 TaxID=3384827 RepID=UPI00399EF006
MSIIYVLIPLAIILVGIAVIVFFWAVRSNQFEDLDRQGFSILFDDDLEKKKDKQESKGSAKNSEDIK